MTLNPLVSIVIPVYNGSNFLREAIESALSQTYKNIEVIVVNDGSTDKGATEKLAKSYGNKIRYFYKENGGISTALNSGIRQMKGEYFSWLSHDDVYYPDKINQEINYLKLHHDIKIVYEDYDYIDTKGKKLKSICTGDISPDDLLFRLFIGSPINGCNLLIHKNCFDRVGLFEEKLRTTQDYDMWFKMALKFKMIHLPIITGGNRMHDLRDTKRLSDLCYAQGNEMYVKYLKLIKPKVLLKSSGYKSYPNLLLFLARDFTRRNYLPASNFAYSRSFEYHWTEKGFSVYFWLQVIHLRFLQETYRFLRLVKRSIVKFRRG